MKTAAKVVIFIFLLALVIPFVLWLTKVFDYDGIVSKTISSSEVIARSAIVAICGATIQISVSVSLGFLLWRFHYPALSVLGWSIFPLSLTGLSAAMSWKAILYSSSIGRIFLSDESILGFYSVIMRWGDIAVILVDSWTWIPLMAGLFYFAFHQISSSITDAVFLDRASEWLAFTDVFLPLVRSYVGLALVFRWADSFATFTIPWSFYGESAVISYASPKTFSEMMIARDQLSALAIVLGILIAAIPVVVIGRTFLKRIMDEEF